MKFLSVTLCNFGPFLEQSFDFAKGEHGSAFDLWPK